MYYQAESAGIAFDSIQKSGFQGSEEAIANGSGGVAITPTA
jgi:hypothetical protein